MKRRRTLIAERIRETREGEGLNLRQAAEIVETAAPVWRMWELTGDDQRLPSASALVRIAEEFDVSTDWLLGLED